MSYFGKRPGKLVMTGKELDDNYQCRCLEAHCRECFPTRPTSDLAGVRRTLRDLVIASETLADEDSTQRDWAAFRAVVAKARAALEKKDGW